MLANGVPPKVAAERLGYADPTFSRASTATSRRRCSGRRPRRSTECGRPYRRHERAMMRDLLEQLAGSGDRADHNRLLV
jgi:hypothetical protein